MLELVLASLTGRVLRVGRAYGRLALAIEDNPNGAEASTASVHLKDCITDAIREALDADYALACTKKKGQN